MGFADIFTSFGKLAGQMAQSAKDRKLAEKDQKQRMAMIESLDWEPMYASQNVPTYQKTQSPVARSYLESFLLGSNPDAIREGSVNAGALKAGAQQRQNTMYGTPEARAQRSQQLLTETPWKVETPTRPVVDKATQSAAMQSVLQPKATEAGLTPDQMQDLVTRGLIKEGADLKGWAPTKNSAIANAITAGDYDAVERMLTYKPELGVYGREKNRKSRERYQAVVDKYKGA